MNEIVLRDWLWATWDYLVQGGWIMIPMIVVSIAMWTLILERWRTFHALGGRDVEPDQAVRALENQDVPVDRTGLRTSLVRTFLAERIGPHSTEDLVLHAATEKLRKSLHRRLAVISVLAAIAPLMGLLGTVLGMIETFEVIAIFGTSNAKAMAGGISVALITTQTGLLVAIPGLFISGSLGRRAKRLESNLDEFSLYLRRMLQCRNGESLPDPGPDQPPFLAMEAKA